MTATTAVTPDPLVLQRDDGPLALALGRRLRAARHAVPLALAGLAPVVATIAVDGAGAPRGLVAAELAWLVVCLGASGGAPAAGRLGWTGPPLVRLAECLSLIWIAVLDDAAPAAFALLAVLAFRHYERLLRLGTRGTTTPAWVDAVALGWEGRLILGFALLEAGALPGAWYAWAALLAVVFVGEAGAGWVGAGATPGGEDDEEVPA